MHAFDAFVVRSVVLVVVSSSRLSVGPFISRLELLNVTNGGRRKEVGEWLDKCFPIVHLHTPSRYR